jgi:hypothetical protein
LKLDIEGGELDALRGIKSLLKNHKIDLIYSEVSFSEIYENQNHFHDIASYLYDYGYKLFDLVYLVKSLDGQIYYGDAIFLSPNLMKNYSIFPGPEFQLEVLLDQKEDQLKQKEGLKIQKLS